jgi:hypothetical protein
MKKRKKENLEKLKTTFITVIFHIRADQNTPPLSGSQKKTQKRPYLGQGLLSFGL